MKAQTEIRKARKLSGLTLKEVSTRSGLAIDTIRRAENSGTATEASLRLLATALGLPAGHFLDAKPGAEPARTRLVLELELPKGFDLTDTEADFVGKRFRHWAKDMISAIIELRGKW